MIPLRDVIPSRTTPVVTIAIILANTVAFVYEVSLPGTLRQEFARTYGLVAARFDLLAVPTSMFLHGGWLHVAVNMLYLWIFGDTVEDRLGHARFLVFYLLCGTVAALGQVAAGPHATVPMVGASGAVAGVMGAYFVLYPNSRILTLLPLGILWDIVEVPALFFLGFWFLLQLFGGVGSIARTTAEQAGGLAFWGQAAGFLAGVVAVFIFRRPERLRVEWWGD